MRLLYTVILIMALPRIFDLGSHGCSASPNMRWLKRSNNSLKDRKGENNVIYYPIGPFSDQSPHSKPDHNSFSVRRHELGNNDSPFVMASNQSAQTQSSTETTWTDELVSITEEPTTFWEKFSSGGVGPKEGRVRKRNAQARRSIKQDKLHRRMKRERKKMQRRLQKRKNMKKNKKQRKIKRRRSKKLDNFIEDEEDKGNSITRDNGDIYIDCCPSKEVVRRSAIGKGRDNHAVHVKNTTDLFYEVECLHGVEGNECTFPPRMVRKGYQTECVQKYSYTQAHVRSFGSVGPWRIDYIQVKSGCSCEIRVEPKKRK